MQLVSRVNGTQFLRGAHADIFGSGDDVFEIKFVTIGSPGNAGDMLRNRRPEPDNAGSVDYEYRIGKYEISEQMINKASALGDLDLTIDARGPNKPATRVSWFEGARFVNWLNTSTGFSPAYKFNERIVVDGRGQTETFFDFKLWESSDLGYDPENLFRNTRAKYFLPSVDEWYKAAFFDPISGTYFDYTTGSNERPLAVPSGQLPGTAVFGQFNSVGPADVFLAGGESPFGTVGQGGNAQEFMETEFDLVNDSILEARFSRGGSWNGSAISLRVDNRGALDPSREISNIGFRVASVIPEPSSLALIAFLCLIAMVFARGNDFRSIFSDTHEP